MNNVEVIASIFTSDSYFCLNSCLILPGTA